MFRKISLRKPFSVVAFLAIASLLACGYLLIPGTPPANAVAYGNAEYGLDELTGKGTVTAQIWRRAIDGGDCCAPSPEGLVCTGTVVGDFKVLTARHCFVDDEGRPLPATRFYVRTGSVLVGEGVKRPIVTMQSRFDVALVTTAGPVETYGVPSAVLPHRFTPVRREGWFYASGFGEMADGQDSDVARWMSGWVTREYDRDHYGGPAFEFEDPFHTNWLLPGDSGGAVYQSRRTRLNRELRILYGVISERPVGGKNAYISNLMAPDTYDWLVARGVLRDTEHDELRKRDLRIMPLGDSITYGVGSSHQAGYRKPLWDKVQPSKGPSPAQPGTGPGGGPDAGPGGGPGTGPDAGQPGGGSGGGPGQGFFDFVGSVQSGDMEDRDNEGHPGKRIDEIARFADCSVEALRPNVVLLHAGTNDINQNYQLDTAPTRLRGLINQVLEDAPETTVLVAKIIPATKPGMQANIDRYNAAIPGVVEQLRAEGKRVRLVDAASALTPEDVNGAHPDDTGYHKLSEVWADGLVAAVQEGLIQQPVKGSGQSCGSGGGPGGPGEIGPGWRALGTIAPGMGGKAGKVDLVELNGDNRADYVKILPDGSVRAALNTPGANGRPHWVDQGVIAPGVGQPGESVRFADVNADGRDDYLVVGARGSVWSFLNNRGSDGKFHWKKEGRIFPSYDDTKPVGDESGIESEWQREDVRLADVSGDGKADYLVVGPAGSMDAYVRAAPGTANNWFKVDTFATGTKAGGRDRMRLGDVNGDGKADYLIVGGTGAVHAYINHMDGLSTGKWTEHKYFADETNYPDTAVAFRDVTGDGKADYLVVEGERIQAWENRGGNTTPSTGASGS
jgi:lysophospholipase L1-like esterase